MDSKREVVAYRYDGKMVDKSLIEPIYATAPRIRSVANGYGRTQRERCSMIVHKSELPLSNTHRGYFYVFAQHLAYKSNAIYMSVSGNNRYRYAETINDLAMMCSVSRNSMSKFVSVALKKDVLGMWKSGSGVKWVVNPYYAHNGDTFPFEIYALFKTRNPIVVDEVFLLYNKDKHPSAYTIIRERKVGKVLEIVVRHHKFDMPLSLLEDDVIESTPSRRHFYRLNQKYFTQLYQRLMGT